MHYYSSNNKCSSVKALLYIRTKTIPCTNDKKSKHQLLTKSEIYRYVCLRNPNLKVSFCVIYENYVLLFFHIGLVSAFYRWSQW